MSRSPPASGLWPPEDFFPFSPTNCDFPPWPSIGPYSSSLGFYPPPVRYHVFAIFFTWIKSFFFFRLTNLIWNFFSLLRGLQLVARAAEHSRKSSYVKVYRTMGHRTFGLKQVMILTRNHACLSHFLINRIRKRVSLSFRLSLSLTMLPHFVLNCYLLLSLLSVTFPHPFDVT